MPPVFDTFDDDIDELAERAADPDPGIRRVAMMELAEAVGTDAKVLLLKGSPTMTPPCAPPPPRRSTSMTAPTWSRASCARSRMPTRTCGASAAETLSEKKEPTCGPLLIERAEHADPFVQAAALRRCANSSSPMRSRRP